MGSVCYGKVLFVVISCSIMSISLRNCLIELSYMLRVRMIVVNVVEVNIMMFSVLSGWLNVKLRVIVRMFISLSICMVLSIVGVS